MYRKSVTQRMRRDRFVYTGGPTCLLAGVFDGLSRDRLTWMSTREQPLLRMCGLPVGAQNLKELRRQHHVPILAALALIDPDDHPLAIDSAGLQTNSFRYTQASSVTGGQDYALFSTRNASEEMYDFLRTQNDRQFLRLPGKRKHIRERPFPLEGDLVEEAQCRNGDVY